MKSKLLSLMAILLIANYGLAQVLVNTNPQLKNAVLEEYTGIHCQYCPDGHAIAQALFDVNPGRVVLINIHQGSFSVPSSGEPDYRTPFGDQLASQTGLTGYPSGTVNRHLFNGAASTALNRGSWGAAATTIMADTSPVNIGISSAYDAPSRTLTVTVEVYYTSSSAASTNYLNIALLQDSIYGPQTAGGMGSNYHHKHMLRHLITGQWGDTINNTLQGRLVSRTYNYVVPAAYTNINCFVEDCHIAAFVAESHQEIYTGDVVYAIGGTNKYIGQINSPTEIIKAGTSGTVVNFNTTAKSALQSISNFTFTLTPEDMPSDWSASYTIDGNTYTSPATVSIDPANPKAVMINVLPGNTPALPKFRLSMKSDNDPMAPSKMIDLYVIANITDLVVNGTGGEETTTFDSIYLNGLTFAGNVHNAATSARIIAPAVASNALVDVNNIYLNIGWTFPALKDDEATAIMSFMDNGGNVFIAGQDIGWDIMSGASGSNGNAITQNFYTNYLHTGFVADGASSNNQLTPVAVDPVFGTSGSSSIIDFYTGNMYPDELSAPAGTFPVFNYNNGTKIAATRYATTNYKTVYLGLGLEMLGNKATKNVIVKAAHDWFYGLVSVPEIDLGNQLTIYPNPASSVVTMTFETVKTNGIIQVTDITGRLLKSVDVPAGSAQMEINVSDLQGGYYFVRLIGQSKVYKLEVLK